MKYLFIEYQDGGCGYTIGCGVRVSNFEADSMGAAIKLYRASIEDGYREDGAFYSNPWTGEFVPDRVSVYEVAEDGIMLDMEKIREEVEAEIDALEDAENEKKEREELERLQAKYK